MSPRRALSYYGLGPAPPNGTPPPPLARCINGLRITARHELAKGLTRLVGFPINLDPRVMVRGLLRGLKL